MARAKTQTAPEPAPVLECCIAHAYDDPETGAPVTITQGTKLRSDNPLTHAAPELWCDVNAPYDERPKVDFGKGGVQTMKPRRRPDGWRRDGAFGHSKGDWADD